MADCNNTDPNVLCKGMFCRRCKGIRQAHTEKMGGYQPLNKLDTSTPPQGGSAVPAKLPYSREEETTSTDAPILPFKLCDNCLRLLGEQAVLKFLREK